MVTKTYLNGSFTKLKTWLEELKLFARVELNDESSPSSVHCKDGNGKELLSISVASNAYTVKAYLNGGDSQCSATYSSNNPRFENGYACGNGGMLRFAPTSSGYARLQAHLLLTKTNTGKVAVIFSSAQSTSNSLLQSVKSFYAVTIDDVLPVNEKSMQSERNANLTQLVSFCTGCALGEISYTPDAFFSLISQGDENMTYEECVDGDTSYLTNGFWSIRDGSAKK